MISTATAGSSARTTDGCSGRSHQSHERNQRNAQDHGHEHARDAVRQALNRRLRGLRLAHQPHDLRQHALGSHCRRFELESARSIDGGADDPIAGLFVDGNGFAREHRLVDRASAGEDASIHREPLARADDDEIAGAHLRDRDVHLGAAAAHARDRGLQPGELPERGQGLHLGSGLERVAQQQQRQNEDDRLVVDVGAGPAGQEQAGRQCRRQRIREGRAGADGDQDVHVGGAVAHGFPGADVEVATGPGHGHDGHPQQGREQPPAWHLIQRGPHVAQPGIDERHHPALERIGRGVAGVIGGGHQRHRQDHRREPQSERGDRLDEELAILRPLRGLAGIVLRQRVGHRLGQARLVAGVVDRRHEHLWRRHPRVVGDGGGMHHEVHRGLGDAWNRSQRALHVRLARGARHPFDRQRDLDGERRGRLGRSGHTSQVTGSKCKVQTLNFDTWTLNCDARSTWRLAA